MKVSIIIRIPRCDCICNKDKQSIKCYSWRFAVNRRLGKEKGVMRSFFFKRIPSSLHI